MDSVKFSIIVPIYNIDKYLHQCIDSILEQTYTNFELILVDDGSKDNSSLICDSYAKDDQRIVVIHKENGGLVSARKAGALKATGDYVACIDGDDWIESNYLEDAFQIIEEYRNIDMICTDIRKICLNRIEVIKNIMSEGLYNSEDIVKEIYPLLIHNKKCEYFNVNICGKIVKRNIYLSQQMKIDNRISIGEDAVLTPLLVTNLSMIYISHRQQYYNYRHIGSGMTSKKKGFDWNTPILQYQSIVNNIDINKYDFKQQLYRKTVHDIFTVVVSHFFAEKNNDDIITEFLNLKENNECKRAIELSSFHGLKSRLMKYSISHSRLTLISIYAKIKKEF